MNATQAATKPRAPASPLAEAQLDQEQAGADVQRLTKTITELRQKGPGSDPALLGCLQAELEDASKLLRRVDLEAAEQIAAASGPLSPKVLEKIRLRRRKVADLHAAVLGRMGESQRLREHLGRVRNEIAALKDSWEFREAQQEIRNTYIFPRDPEARDNPAPTRGARKTPKSMEKLARLERDLETTTAELKIAAAAQISASQRWEAEKAVLDGWVRAVDSLGPAARAVLDSMPRPGAATMGAVTNQTDFRAGIPGFTTPLIR